MNRVIYNTCFGGYNLSREATTWIINHLESVELPETKDIYALSDMDRDTFNLNTQRHSPLLLQCFDELGSEAMSGRYAELAVAEIEGNKYYINEYDGNENVSTPADEANKWEIIDV